MEASFTLTAREAQCIVDNLDVSVETPEAFGLKHYTSNLLIELEDTVLRCVTTDGHLLTLLEFKPCRPSGSGQLTIPWREFAAAIRWLCLKRSNSTVLEFTFGTILNIAVDDARPVSARLYPAEGVTFPDWRRPFENARKAEREVDGEFWFGPPMHKATKFSSLGGDGDYRVEFIAPYQPAIITHSSGELSITRLVMPIRKD